MTSRKELCQRYIKDGEKFKNCTKNEGKDKTTANPFWDESLKDLKRLLFYSARIPKNTRQTRVTQIVLGNYFATLLL